MSNIIPMVSSSPPPMDEGGEFDWDDDDDEFGTFASADTTCGYKVKNDSTIDMNQSSEISQHERKDEFADFTAFENKNGSYSAVTEADIGVKKNDSRPETIPLSTSDLTKVSSVQEANQMNISTINGTLTDSGMFSSEISPVPLNGERITIDDKCKNSESLDDSFSDSTKPIVKKYSECVDMEKYAVVKGDYNQTDIDIGEHSSTGNTHGESVIKDGDKHVSTQGGVDLVNTTSSEHCKVVQSDDSTMCSDNKTASDNDSIPTTEINHSTNDCDIDNINISGNTLGTENINEYTYTDRFLHDSVSQNPHATLGLEGEQTNFGLDNVCDNGKSRDLSGDVPGIPETNSYNEVNNDDVEEDQCSVSSENVKTYINDTIIPEAVKKFSENDIENDGNEIENVPGPSNSSVGGLNSPDISDSQSYQENKNVDTSGSKESLNVKCGEEAESELSHDDCFGVSKDSVQNNEGENDHIPTNSCFHEDTPDDFGDFSSVDKSSFTNSISTSTSDNHFHQRDSQNSSPEVVCSDQQSAILSDGTSDFICTKDTLTKGSTIPSEVPKTETDISNEDDDIDDFGDFSSIQKASHFNIGESIKTTSIANTTNITDDDDDDDDDFGDFSAGQIKPEIAEEEAQKPISCEDTDDNDFGDFSVGTNSVETAGDASFQDSGFANFTSKSTESAADNWAAFDDTPTAVSVDNLDEDDDWGEFGDESSFSESQPVKLLETQQQPPSLSLQHMTKHEKLVYAVESCFPDAVTEGSKMDLVVKDLTNTEDKSPSAPDLWVLIKSLQSFKEITYQWSKSEWNSQLFTTLHIDTKNVLIGHKKASVPIFASGLTLLEPVKGTGAPILKPDVLVDTMKVDTVVSHSQETIPPAQFDWTSSGLTNPLEANNKTLNLDFLIQDQSAKSTELESEFLGPDLSEVTKPTIQPLENILANLKTSSSTFKPLTQTDDISTEAQRVVQSLPNLSFMKSRVLIFPLHMD